MTLHHLMIAVGIGLLAGGQGVSAEEGAMGDAMSDAGVYGLTMQTIDGKPQPLAAFRGQVLLIVNTASRCGFTPQYKELEALHERYQDRGFSVLGFPSNDFMGQEPGTNEEIKQFCELRFGVTFPMFAKIRVKGKEQDPLYRHLTTAAGLEGPISWNFNKFLVDRSGRVVARYDSKVTPESPELTAKLEALLAEPAEGSGPPSSPGE